MNRDPQNPTKRKKRGKRLLCILSGILLVLLGCAGLSALWQSDPANIRTYLSDNPYIVPMGQTMISAHRSGGGIAPEESMMAFKNCVENGGFTVDALEFDLHLTKDGVLVLLHDDTLERTTDAAEVFGVSDARPEDYTYEELRLLNIGAKFTTEEGDMPFAALHGTAVPEDLRIVRLEDLLDYLEAHGRFAYFIETKNSGERGKQAVDTLYAVLKVRGLVQRTIWGTFQGEITRYVDETYPDLPRSASIREVLGFYGRALVNSKNYAPRYAALSLPCSMPFPLIANLATARMLNYAHAHGVAAQYWTVNSEKQMRYLLSVGADCIMTDYPDRLYALRNPG